MRVRGVGDGVGFVGRAVRDETGTLSVARRTHTIKCGGSVNGACEGRVVRDGTADFRTCSGSPQFPRVYNSTVRKIEERESSHFAALQGNDADDEILSSDL